VRDSTAHPSPEIQRGIRGLTAVAACTVTDSPTLDRQTSRWVVRLTLTCETESEFVATSTCWCLLVDDAYPFGRVSIYPAADGGMTTTFPHQSRNTLGDNRRAWREGLLCLDAPLGGERRVVLIRDPVGDAEQRLRWHAERALEWLRRAANGQLLAASDPFELPHRPHTTKQGWQRARIVHDESAASFTAWSGRTGCFGIARLGSLKDLGNVFAIKSFADQRGKVVRAWSGRDVVELPRGRCVDGYWWLWPQPVVLPPWQAPATWHDLRKVGEAMDVDPDALLRWLGPQLRRSKFGAVLMLGYPIPRRVGEDACEVHWDALLLPSLKGAAGQPRGFRPKERRWWHLSGSFANSTALEYLFADNWSGDRLQARGRLPPALCDCNIAVFGVGALGAVLSELLVRAGVKKIALFDDDILESGNVCRHVATLADVGESKVSVVAQRLRQISPTIRVAEKNEKLPSDTKAIEARLDKYDIIIDCTSSDVALSTLERAWWSIPRTFASFSMGFGGKRLFSFGVSGNRFPHADFAKSVRPWLEHESKAWADSDEVHEGAGCWSPLFPARHDDVVLAAAFCVKELETLLAKAPTEPRFRVFAQSFTDEGFQGFAPEIAPPASEGS
jgi:hypothetical protein